MRTFDLVTLRIVLGSFGAFAIFRSLDLMIRQRQNLSSGYKSKTVRFIHEYIKINRTLYMESPMTPSHLIWSEGQSQGHLDFEALCLVKTLGHMLLLNTNSKAYMESPLV